MRESGRDSSGERARERGQDGRTEARRIGGHEKLAEPSWSERVVAVIGAALTLGAVGYLTIELLLEPSTPPDIVIEVAGVDSVHTGYVVEFRARNLGHTTAARLEVEGTLERGTTIVETSSTTIDFVPADGASHAGLYFRHDPREYRLQIVPKGYDRP
ncbi:MAG TPA: hypothetical protein VF212_15945 [Longimicrobiales bacterium]